MAQYIIAMPQLAKNYQAESGRTLMQFMQNGGIYLEAPCGGKGTCRKCLVTVNGEQRLACRTVIDRDMTVLLPDAAAEHILTGAKGCFWPAEPIQGYTMAFDVGTTTIAGYLMDGSDGRELAAVSAPNPQREFGADVITRIQYALGGEAGKLRQAVLDALASLVCQATDRAGISPEEISRAALVGNTCMHHLLLGIDTEPLSRPPYSAAVTQALTLPARDFLPAGKDALLYVLPNIAGFVGADTVGCLLASGIDEANGWTLLVDIGTNGEMVLGRGERRIACSTAAGPAFEGAKIECGMSGAEGAIDHVWADEDKIYCSVIGGGHAVGICGSGLLDAAAVLLEKGVIAPNGRMAEKRVYLKDGVFLSQKDVRQIQLAKAAIRAGIELMARTMGIACDEIDRLLLAGAFGNYMSPKSACAIGLLPPVLLNRIQPVGNAAGAGAKAAAISTAAFEKAQELACSTGFLELAALPEFQDTYLKMLDFREAKLWKN